MKQFVIKLSFLSIIIIICDVVIGKTMDYVVKNITVGGRGRDNYICDKSVDDILIFGSSRAVHHYNSTMIEDSLGMSCYNCGDDGNGIILSYGRLLMIEDRHKPLIIIYDVNPSFDIEQNDNSKYLGWLKARYERKGIAQIFKDVDKTEQYKMMSNMYRHNSTFFQNLITFLTSISNDTGDKGFRPIDGEFDKMKIDANFDINSDSIENLDSLKIGYIKQFIEASKDAKLFFVVSPIWYGMNTQKTNSVKQLCKEMNIPFIDFSNNYKYVHNSNYFSDGVHLNRIGADEFTKDLISKIK